MSWSRWANLPLRTKVFAVPIVPILPLAVFATFVVSTAQRARDTGATALRAEGAVNGGATFYISLPIPSGGTRA